MFMHSYVSTWVDDPSDWIGNYNQHIYFKVTSHSGSTENKNTSVLWHRCAWCRLIRYLCSPSCSLSALGLPAAKQSSLTTLAASVLAKWFKCCGTKCSISTDPLKETLPLMTWGVVALGARRPRASCTTWRDRTRDRGKRRQNTPTT